MPLSPLFVLLFLALAAYGQTQERVAIINTVDNNDSLSHNDLSYLTNKLRETAVNILPKQRYGVMTTESIVAFLGSQEALVRECKASSCLAELGRKVSADYVAQARVGRFGQQLTINFDLYKVASGNLIGSFAGNSKDIFGLLAIIEEKSPALFKQMTGTAGGISGLEKTVDYEFGGGKSYLVNLSTEPPGAILSFNGMPSASCPRTPCKAELREGNVRIIAALEQYEAADTTVSIARNNQNIAIRLKSNFGILEIRPAYLDGVGSYDDWSLSINNKLYRSFENRLSPGNYNVKLSHRCYEVINFMAGINKGSREVFDMADHIKLKKGGLILSAEKNGEPASEPVFVNGKRVGDTPFSDAVPLCSKIEIGNSMDIVKVDLKYNERVKYVHKLGETYTNYPDYNTSMPAVEKSSRTSFWVALGLDLLGAIFIYSGYAKHNEMWDAHEKYYNIGSNSAWEDVENNHSSRNTLYAIGGIFLASGVGVHIWF